MEDLQGQQGQEKPKQDQQQQQETPKQDENMIPKSRFDEVNSKYKEMAEKLAKFEELESTRQKELEEKELQSKKEQGKFEELYQATQKELESYKQYEERTKQLESTILSMVEQKLETVPKEMHDLVPTNLSAEDTLSWLSKAEAKGLFATPEVKDIGKPSNKSQDTPKVDKANMSALDKILSGLGK